ncbi:hypothetical protein N480_03560 [Pseudoalteromonas luteoviolacea S2607]|uniref:hypothetical protein n=1 Tax=Pseudoalteromonas luteoviolacea TaxID=43657 RepID=UPI0007B0690B|nr:hypothetical protein [Pseudoalteromonas luteoviolacea]KZN30034.1 hypothetical protein N480_03560 [Pseudoalteromonas luteoviolacea S2607]
MTNILPKELERKVWHVTSLENAKKIIAHGSIIANPDIPESERWGGSCESVHPFARSINGISLFDLRQEKALKKHPLSYFKPMNLKAPTTIWFEVDTLALSGNFLSPEEALTKKRKLESYRQYILDLEAISLCPIEMRHIKSVFALGKQGKLSKLSFKSL